MMHYDDDDYTNEERADSALSAIERTEKYHPYRHRDASGKWVIDRDSITDLIADLLHLAVSQGYDPADIIETAQAHYGYET